MNNTLKASALAIYVLAVAGASGVLPAGIAPAVQVVAVALLGLHVLEVLVAFGTIRRYRGPLVDSIALTLLFGFLHWWPLRARA